ncbi:uncharacterized protein FYW47_014360 [Aplochiton taeniatus]
MTHGIIMSPAIVLLLLLPLVSAQTFHLGPCPNPKVQPNFDVNRYLGKWYEIERLPAVFESGKCIEANYALRTDGTIRVLNSQTVDGVRSTGEGTAAIQDLEDQAKLGVSFSYLTPYSPYWVLTTDYTGYVVVYGCTDILRLFRFEFAWILSRSRFPPNATVESAKQLLRTEHIDISGMTPTDQTNCKDYCIIMSPAIVLLLLLPLVSAQTFHLGPCPNPKVQPNFDVNQYLGKWYEIERLPASFESGKCIEANYALRTDGTIQVLNIQTVDGVRVPAEGTGTIMDSKEPAKLGVSFSYWTPYSPYWVLTTDYTGYVVVYSCTDILRLFRIEFAWILSRSRFPPNATVESAKQLLRTEHIDISGMTPTDQTGCEDF